MKTEIDSELSELETSPMEQHHMYVKPLQNSRSIVFQPPFFELEMPVDNMTNCNTIIARCLTCKVSLKGMKHVNSNFIKHLKRIHPSVHKMYVHQKAIRSKALKIKRDLGNASSSYSSGEEAQKFDLQNNSSLNDDSRSDSTSSAANQIPVCVEMDLKTLHNRIETQTNDFANEYLMKRGDSQEVLERVKKRLKIEHLVTKTELDQFAAAQERKSACLEKQLNAVQKQCQELQSSLQKLQSNRRDMQLEVEDIDQHLRHNKIIINNLKIEDINNTTQEVEKFINEELLLPDIRIISVLSVSSNPSDVSKKTLKVELNESDANIVILAAKKLKNTEVSVEPDLSRYASKRRNKLIVLSKEIMRRNEKLNVAVCGTRLVLNDNHYFYWDDVDGLCDLEHSDNPIEKLNRIGGGSDYHEFIGFLKHFDLQIA